MFNRSSAAPFLIRGEGRESIYVAFGTGKYLEGTDRSSAAANSFYVVHDDGTKTADSTGTPTSAIAGRGRLQPGVFDNETGRIEVSAFVWGRPASDADSTQRSGWYFDFRRLESARYSHHCCEAIRLFSTASFLIKAPTRTAAALRVGAAANTDWM